MLSIEFIVVSLFVKAVDTVVAVIRAAGSFDDDLWSPLASPSFDVPSRWTKTACRVNDKELFRRSLKRCVTGVTEHSAVCFTRPSKGRKKRIRQVQIHRSPFESSPFNDGLPRERNLIGVLVVLFGNARCWFACAESMALPLDGQEQKKTNYS